MALGEFELIERFFTRQQMRRADVPLGVGDDCALLRPPPGQLLAVTVDAMVEGVHFLAGADAEALGHKALAVSLSDLAATGAEPAWATLVLSLPEADPAWPEAFARGLLALAGAHGVELVGGDTVRGPRAVTTQLHGFVAEGQALLRSGARPGDLIYVTGTLGDAGAGLRIAQGTLDGPVEVAIRLRARLDRPEPRVASGLALRGLASAAIDISDGLAADLGHLLERSGVGAAIEVDRLPLSSDLVAAVEGTEARERLALTAGDDYELLFTVPPGKADEVERRLASLPGGATRIGVIETAPGLRLADRAGLSLDHAGYDHFGGAR